ncbi:DAK2 domain-containing protein [Cellulomonas soli]|uniref:DhaL domain-containing protein n=1 Tax=Cellulomonas soli TaxID=931535 RepID=A0A512PDW7_9CELL|nr:DAK2 domain-containing protein [Cellulomonas soli]NYI60024.1 hypothetical protein [Cellulomonas soli]GEP69322.1 hypothetical protein CSO01_20370 [Cellulomonas soli]
MDGLDGRLLRRWAHAAHEALVVAHERIDAVNVFPVADADTGTNVLLTVTGGRQALDVVPQDAGAGEVAHAFAHGALLAARGNSGVILSQYLAGLARGLPAVADATALATAFGSASRSARAAVTDPQEGTVLTVARDVADGAQVAADAGADLGTLLDGVLADAHRSLARISSQHPVLRAAHVLDAGACALLVVLDSLARVVRGEGPPSDADLAWLPVAGVAAHGIEGGGAFEVMLLVRTSGDTGSPALDDGSGPGALLRERLPMLGDSVAVVGADGWWHVHVHTDAPAEVVAACAVGAREQVVVRLVAAGHAGTVGTLDEHAPSGVVVCTASPGLAAWYAALGAVVVLRCPETPLGARHLGRAVVDAGTGAVTVLTGGVVEKEVLADLAAVPGPWGERLQGVQVVETGDELGATVALLALTGSAPDGHAWSGARAAVQRLRSTALGRPGPGAPDGASGTGPGAGPDAGPDGVAGRAVADVLEAVDALEAGWPSDAAPAEHLTLLHGEQLAPDDLQEIATRLEAVLATRHPMLELLVLGPAAGIDGLRAGLD